MTVSFLLVVSSDNIPRVILRVVDSGLLVDCGYRVFLHISRRPVSVVSTLGSDAYAGARAERQSECILDASHCCSYSWYINDCFVSYSYVR